MHLECFRIVGTRGTPWPGNNRRQSSAMWIVNRIWRGLTSERSIAMSVAGLEKYLENCIAVSLDKSKPDQTHSCSRDPSDSLSTACSLFKIVAICFCLSMSCRFMRDWRVHGPRTGKSCDDSRHRCCGGPRYEGSSEYHAIPFPILTASRGIFFVDGLEGGVAYDLGDHFKVGALVSAEFGRMRATALG